MFPTSTSLPAELLPFLESAGTGIGAGIAFLDADGRFLFVSEGLAQMNGVSLEDHLGRTIAEVLPDLWPQVAGIQAQVLAGEPAKIEFTTTTPAYPDHPHTWEEYWTPVRGTSGVIGVVATVVDVTDLRAAQARTEVLLVRQAALRRVANAALSDRAIEDVFDDALCALETALGVPLTRMMRLQVGSSRLGALVGRGWDDEMMRRIPIGPREGSFADLILRSPGAVQFSDLTRDQSLFYVSQVFQLHGIVSGLGVPVRSGDRPWGIIAAYDRRPRVFDADEVAFIEELAVILGLMVRERESRAFREEVMSMATHQMRTPLTSVIGLAQHLQRRIAQGRIESAVDLVGSLVGEAFRLDDVLSQWNELAAAESYREVFASERIDPAATVAERVAQFRDRHPGVTVREDYPASSITIDSDAHRIGEIVDNLLENARKYGGGLIDVRLERRGDGVAVHCRDHGPGIPAEIEPRIFDRFFRGAVPADAADGHGGMGLGLYISRMLAEGLGGTLDVTSAPGEGAEFTLSLPRERSRPAAAPAAPSAGTHA